MNAVSAENEAGEASDALASARFEIKRLKDLLESSNDTKALEAMSSKVGAMSAHQSLHAAQRVLKVMTAEIILRGVKLCTIRVSRMRARSRGIPCSQGN